MNPSTFRSNLKTLLDARGALTTLSAQVFRYPPGAQSRLVPTLFVGPIANTSQEDGTLLPSSTLDRTYTISGGGYAPGSGATDAKWGTAESNAWTLISELTDQCLEDETINSACTQARLTNWSLTPSQDDDGRVYMDIDWTITARVIG